MQWKDTQEAVLEADTMVRHTGHGVVQQQHHLPQPGTGPTTATISPPSPGSPAWETKWTGQK